MIVTPLEIELRLPPPRIARAEGIHVSAIIRCVAIETGILQPDWAEELSLVDVRTITNPDAVLRISIGLAWEEWYIPNVLVPLLGVNDHPDGVLCDGVYMSPDGESVSVVVTDRPHGNVLQLFVHEVKATYKSINTVGDLTSQFIWLAQMKAYCMGMGTRFAVLHVLFLCGDYKFPIRPQLRAWRIEFTQQEIDDNWTLLRDYKEARRIADATA